MKLSQMIDDVLIGYITSVVADATAVLTARVDELEDALARVHADTLTQTLKAKNPVTIEVVRNAPGEFAAFKSDGNPFKKAPKCEVVQPELPIGNVTATQQTKKPRVKKERPIADSTRVFAAYEYAMIKRYGPEVPVPRNGKINNQLIGIMREVGLERAIELARAYVMSNDRFYVLKRHPLGLLLKDLHTINVTYATGKRVSVEDARTIEKTADSAQGSIDFLTEKYGDQNA